MSYYVMYKYCISYHLWLFPALWTDHGKIGQFVIQLKVNRPTILSLTLLQIGPNFIYIEHKFWSPEFYCFNLITQFLLWKGNFNILFNPPPQTGVFCTSNILNLNCCHCLFFYLNFSQTFWQNLWQVQTTNKIKRNSNQCYFLSTGFLLSHYSVFYKQCESLTFATRISLTQVSNIIRDKIKPTQRPTLKAVSRKYLDCEVCFV